MKSKIIIVFFLSLVSLCNARLQVVDLYTPNGSQLYAFEFEETNPADIARWNADCALTYPNAEILATATETYNCHSYAWNITEGGPIYCVYQCRGYEWDYKTGDYSCIKNLHVYWEDDSYEETTEANAVKIFYYHEDSDHSAVKSTTHAGKYESKWGSWPLVRHDPEYGPYYYMDLRRYYRRKFVPICYNESGYSFTPINPPAGTITWTVTPVNDFYLEPSTTDNSVTIYRTGMNPGVLKGEINGVEVANKILPLCFPSFSFPYQTVSVDDVYLACGRVNLQNVTITNGAKLIVISCGDISVQNVKVQNNAKLTLEAAGEVIFNGDFELQLGSELEIR